MDPIVKSALEAVRSKPEIFIGPNFGKDGVFDDRRLAYRLVSDPMTYKYSPITVEHINGWWLVSAKQDWLVKAGSNSISELFNRVVDFPEAGANGIRSEIMLNAFADDVVTYGIDGKIIVKGCESGLADIEFHINSIFVGSRVIAFRIRNNNLDSPRVAG